ncbi:MAG: hypothetical protein HY846_02980 [Nitrosomonadales bacterium]|nr:hypothetical protein [Nitrosomonadales bacterium]
MFHIIIIALWSILSVPCLAAEAPSSGEGMFALFFNYTSNQDLPYCPRTGLSRCVLGTLKRGQTIKLLSSKSSSTCLAHAIESFPSNWDSGSFPLTKINLTSCSDFTFDLAALTNGQTVYELLGSFPAPSASKASEIDVHIRLKASGVKPTSDEHQFVLTMEKPELFRLPNMKSDSYIAVYQNSVTPGDQVHFLYSNGQVQLIHSAATIKSIFSLGDNYFIHYSFTCRVGCGYGGDIVIKFSTDSFERVMFDAPTSS